MSHLGFLVGSPHSILGFPESAFCLSLHLLGDSLHLELRIPGYFARFSFDASHHFIDLTVHSIAIHWLTSMGTACVIY